MSECFGLVQSAEDRGKSQKGFSPDLIQAIRHLRAWRRRRARRIALGGIERVARGEIKELRRLLIRSGVSCEEVSQAMPVLSRCLVKRHREIAKSSWFG